MLEEAVILAGGFGTRLRDVVNDLPKPMAPVCGKPFLEYLFRYLQHQGVRRVVLSVGYLHEKIENHFGKRFGEIEIDYFVEKEPLGTGGGIRAGLTKCKSEQVLVLNGDTFFDIPLSRLESVQSHECRVATIALHKVQDASRYGTVEIKEGTPLIAGFREKDSTKKGESYINAGVYIIERQKFLAMTPENTAFSLETDFFIPSLEKSPVCYAVFNDNPYFIDIGIPSDYQKANEDFRQFRY
ncbi:MAG: D-glycero-alpha-D-manno-heptose 1-phosphate guanylyltransferase [Bacteroidetes bacterium]|nr:MAG: D-glycero-alpha-D-manno-heptose 1-phosphate guanylyltransferase [Bacteroidota bacterium]